MTRPSAPELFCGVLLHGAALLVVCLTLVSVAQPLFTEDMWWHLSMGRAYATAGPWLDSDPNLFTAVGPPSPAAWLSSLSLYALESALGFQALRVAHLLLVGLILTLAWSSLSRVSGSRWYASTATALFTVLSAYRLFQLRADLISLLGAVLIIWLLVIPAADARGTDATKRNRIIAAVVLLGLWANGHAGFLLGPILLVAAIGAIVLARAVGAPLRASSPARIRQLAFALVFGLLATLVNPTGAATHFLFFTAGETTPDLSLVADEWSRIDLFALPPANLPPSLFAWLIIWFLLVLTAVAAIALARQFAGTRSSPPASSEDSVNGSCRLDLDPALLGVAAVSLVAMLSAVRFLWMGIFVLLWIGASARAFGVFRTAARPVHALGSAILGCVLIYGFVAHGAWPMISKGVRWDTYARPYTAAKSNAHAVWFLSDAELEGNLFNRYRSGNFLGYWLAPRLQTFVNGSLNVPLDVMEASFIIDQRAWQSDQSFEGLLDRYAVDVFFATGTPRLSLPNRPVISTTTHLEHTPGWVLVFRSLASAVYLRDNERNRENIARVEAYYARAGVPFEFKDGGFDVARVIREAPGWAVSRGLIPANLQRLDVAMRVGAPPRRMAARERMAGLLAIIGLYQRAEAIDRQTIASTPRAVSATRRLVWSLFHQRRFDEARALAEHLATIAPPEDAISRMLVDSARQWPALSEADRAAAIALLPVVSRAQARQISTGFVVPEAR